MVKELKCWRKIRHKYSTEFEKGKAGIKITDFESGDFKSKGFVVYIRPEKSRFSSRTEFKTKPQAFTFAKVYMKKHDKC